MKIVNLTLRTAISASLAVSGVVHAYLYTNGRDIPTVGPAFLLQASVFCALAVLILVGGPAWLQLAAAAGATGLAGGVRCRARSAFRFHRNRLGAPRRTPCRVVAEVLTVVLVGATFIRRRARSANAVDVGQPAAR
jgi:hypothetical protein